MTICGIDEAGRGPIIGPLVIAGVLVDEKDEARLKNIGVKDSKLLTPKQREDLFEKIKEIVKEYEIIIVGTKEIDEAVESETTNLNWLEADKTAKIINKLTPNKAIIDSPSPNLKKYAEYIKNKLKDKKTTLVCEHKADANYPVVAAASILAKVTRDKEIALIEKTIGKPIGSGYPADPYTQEFLKKHLDKYENFVRKSWATYKKLKQEKGQKKLGGF